MSKHIVKKQKFIKKFELVSDAYQINVITCNTKLFFNKFVRNMLFF